MRKLIIIFSIMLLCVGLFGCAESGDLKIPSNLELKDEYKNSVSTIYTDNFIEYTKHAINMYENINTINKDDLKKDNSLFDTLFDSKEGSKISESEMFLGTKVASLSFDIAMYTIGSDSEEDKMKINEEMKAVLDLYK
ncbi:hypothetical protein [Clostridium sp.]|uniref:hypothetical protein n=1 Tax=Clostridium sp. TaxID=1506 RepID=UPI001A5C7FD0|nr:hypothetical protein [Clostridium sp.]MBK5239828.1 hypothetical protein [Clostridium sp.]